MSEEEKMKMAIDLAKQGIDLEENIKILEEKIEIWKKDPRIMIQEENFKVLQAMENVIHELRYNKEQLKSELGYTRKLNYKGNHIPRID